MPHWRSMMDSDWLRYHDLQGREPTVTIVRVVGGTITGNGGKKNKKPVLYFAGKDKPLAINATIGKTIEAMYGPNTEEWIGKRITLYTSTTEMGGETVSCIRVRPRAPAAEQRPVGRPQPPDRAPGDDEDEDAAARRAVEPTPEEMGEP